ncbi:MAG: M23 family metallopeptidase [Rhodococcus sp.]|nr:M23 family metallopeptidase [Rhodococcus sp. (in: high G+C Gram-positive bacteria)]
MPTVGTLTSEFGQRWGSLHGGIDIANAIGTPIVAATDGTVIDAGPAQGFGNWVRLLSDEGTMTVYGHMEEVLVSTGQRIQAGQTIALMGSRGFSTGSHLHFEVWLNEGRERADPIEWLRENDIATNSVSPWSEPGSAVRRS